MSTNTLIDGVSGQTLINVRNILFMLQSVDMTEAFNEEAELGVFRTLDLCINALDHEIAKGKPTGGAA
ncbi:MAG TPA: hypothetical protein PJ986_04100 [Gammaproteobacteria bacterium]|nr:hypothetical protein [Gammaproteobacteria bacterium]